MIEVNETDLAWAAGAIDGEGCIQIRKLGLQHTSRMQFNMYVAVGNTDIRMPEKLAEMFGGVVYRRSARANHRALYEWRLYSAKAAAVLERVMPYLVIKREQAEVAVEFARTYGVQGVLISDEVRATREDAHNRIAILKRGVG